MKVIVLGTGAIGAYYGAQLARAGHAVTCFARGANLGAIQERGLEVRTPEGGFRAPVTATDRAEELAPADFAILAVKSYSLVDIAPIVRRCAEQENDRGAAAEWSGDGAAPRATGRAARRRNRWPHDDQCRSHRARGGRAAQSLSDRRRRRARRADQRSCRSDRRRVP